MFRDINNKLVVITGGAQGIGYAIADNFLKKGATVVLLDINEETGAEAVKVLTSKYGNKVDFFKCDVSKDLEAVSKEIIDKYKTVDVFVNNAGIGDEVSVRRTMEINAIAVMEWTMKFWEHMRVDNGGKGGTIMNVSSKAGLYSDQYLPYYRASKYAVVGFSKTMGHKENFKKYGVEVIVLCPAFTETKLVANVGSKRHVVMHDEFVAAAKRSVFQKVDHVGEAAIEVFERADSGTAWLIENNKPAELAP